MRQGTKWRVSYLYSQNAEQKACNGKKHDLGRTLEAQDGINWLLEYCFAIFNEGDSWSDLRLQSARFAVSTSE
jgi:hypothetical protein